MCPSADTPLEVQLVNEVKNCRSCQWFWGGTLPFGPYPAFDWSSQLPEAFRLKHAGSQQETGASTLLMTARVTGCKPVEPAIMHGCRKAPIMTMGINPNLSPYFADKDYAARAYPNFTDPANYAFYYRYQTIYQEGLDLQFIKDHAVPGSEVVAEQDGYLLKVERSVSHRWLELTLRYAGEETDRKLEFAWTPEARYVILVQDKRTPTGNFSFRKGNWLAARFSLPIVDDVSIFSYPVDYYERILPSLKRLAAHLQAGQPPGSKVELRVGEDVSQHDMVACASPGWEKYDIPVKRIAANCAGNKAFAVRQLIQSRPAVLILVGSSTVEMFCDQFKGWIDLEYKDNDDHVRDSHYLLKETCTRKKYLKIEVDNYSLQCRLLVVPHFSYSDNYRANCRFSAPSWAAFQADFPGDAEVLNKNGKIKDKLLFGDVTELVIGDRDDPIQHQLSQAAWDVVMAHCYDPHRMIADALIAELGVSLHYNATAGRLERTAGSCAFCNNPSWRFDEAGCPYGKDRELAPGPGYLEDIVATVLRGK